MYVLDPDMVRRLDAATIAAGTPSLELMERAGKAVARSILAKPRALEGCVLVFCGKGNNGGDGLVVARELHRAGHQVCALCVAGPRSEDARVQFERAREAGVELLEFAAEGDELTQSLLDACSRRRGRLVVDALLGTGLKPPLRDDLARWCAVVGGLGRDVLAVDGPSGLDGATGEHAPESPRARWTVALGAMKWGLLEAVGRDRCGRLELVDLGFADALVDELCASGERRARWVDAEWVERHLGRVPMDAHKYSRGSVGIVGGSVGMSGAVALACQGALRAGAGLVEALVPPGERPTVDALCVEALVRSADGQDEVSATRELAARRTALVLGPGAGRDEGRIAATLAFLDERDARPPIVVDADGLHALSLEPREVGDRGVLTPHSGELARLLGVDTEAVVRDRWRCVREAARRYRAVVVHKGAPSVVCTVDGELFVIGSGGPGLATAGSGDVLAGVIGALLAAGLEAATAAAAGAWIHGAAGDRGEALRGTRGLIAGDLPALVAAVLRELEEGSA